MRVRWLPAALSNLERQLGHIAAEDPRAAARVARRVREAVANLGSYPAAGRMGRVPGTRELVVSGTPFVIPYRVAARRVEILRVFHSSQQWPDELPGENP